MIEEKYAYEKELIKMKLETEKLKQEAAREKKLYYREKRRRICDSDDSS